MKQILRHQGKFQCFVLILSLVGQLCFQKTSYINRDTEAPAPLNNTYFELQLRILAHYIYSPVTLLLLLLVTITYTKCFFLFSICMKTKLSRINNGNRTE